MQGQLDAALARAKEVFAESERNVRLINQSRGIAEGGNAKALEAHKMAAGVLEMLSKVSSDVSKLQGAAEGLTREYDRLSAQLRAEVAEECIKAEEIAEKISASILSGKSKETLEEKIKVSEAKARVINEGRFKVTEINWEELRKTLGDTGLLVKISIAIITIALCIYILKYGLPLLINYLTRPYVISETSSSGLFEFFKTKQSACVDDLIFSPLLQKQLLDLLLRVQDARKYDESLPNVLFYGVPGTGKTAFVKALAYSSGLDYALTSGSEFAKITNPNDANNELRRLIRWAQRSKKGLVVFIDEVESLFANRKLPTTSKKTQDFINTFLSLVSDQSQKRVMFIFATNQPFKLDDAITNRIGINIEFTLPEASEREKIFSMYLSKFAKENQDFLVGFHPEINNFMGKYVENLKDFSPRAIKFIAEEMIINARRQEPMMLTHEIVQAVIDKARDSLQKMGLWERERSEWSRSFAVQY